jgi:hypothetical protein
LKKKADVPIDLVKKNDVTPKAMVKYGYYTDIPDIEDVNQGKSYAI